jgi:hypothetical protein
MSIWIYRCIYIYIYRYVSISIHIAIVLQQIILCLQDMTNLTVQDGLLNMICIRLGGIVLAHVALFCIFYYCGHNYAMTWLHAREQPQRQLATTITDTVASSSSLSALTAASSVSLSSSLTCTSSASKKYRIRAMEASTQDVVRATFPKVACRTIYIYIYRYRYRSIDRSICIYR